VDDTETDTTTPDAVCADSEITSIGEASSDDGHGDPVVSAAIGFDPFRVAAQEAAGSR